MIEANLPARFAVVDEFVWRGSRPRTPQEAQALVIKGVRAVLTLELFNWDRRLYPDFVSVRHIPCWEPLPMLTPSVEDGCLILALAALERGPYPIYVHCRDGQNRTGVVIAAYRLFKYEPLDLVLNELAAYQGFWTKPDLRYVRGLVGRRDILQRQVELVLDAAG